MAITTLWLDLNIFVSRVSRSTGIFCEAEKVGEYGRVSYNCRLVMLYSNFTFSLMIRYIYFSATRQLVDLFSHLQKVMTIPWVEVEKSGLVFIRVYDLHTGR